MDRLTTTRTEHDCEECTKPIPAKTTAVTGRIETLYGYAAQKGYYHLACYASRFGMLPAA